MTAPPGGPYGQGPYGSNPYGQGPYWGGQPGQPPPGGPGPYPPGGSYPYPPSGPQPYQQGSPYPYPPPGGPEFPSYPIPPYPPPGQQFPPGPYPPGPPPGGPGSKLPWLIVAGLITLAIIALVATLLVVQSRHGNKSSSGSSTTTSTSVSPPKGSAQNATDCTPNGSGGDMPSGDTITAGKLSFPASTAPGWAPFSDDQNPNLISAVGVSQDVPGANQWMMTAEVAITNFVSSMDLSAQATKLMQCLVNGPGYANSTPTLGSIKTSSITVDGTKAARADADITIGDPTRNVKGDSVTIIAVDTTPVTVFVGSTPIGDAASAALIGRIIAALQVGKS